MTSHTIYEGAMWLPWIQRDVLHKPGDSFYRTTKCGIYVGKDERARSTDLVAGDGRGFVACPDCWNYDLLNELRAEPNIGKEPT